eukprot:1819433-Pyramimonas_sp.AAC.1
MGRSLLPMTTDADRGVLRGCSEGCFGATGEGDSGAAPAAARVVTSEQIWEACGAHDNIPRLKPYQAVGVNFLLLLHQEVRATLYAPTP